MSIDAVVRDWAMPVAQTLLAAPGMDAGTG